MALVEGEEMKLFILFVSLYCSTGFAFPNAKEALTRSRNHAKAIAEKERLNRLRKAEAEYPAKIAAYKKAIADAIERGDEQTKIDCDNPTNFFGDKFNVKAEEELERLGYKLIYHYEPHTGGDSCWIEWGKR